MWNFPSFNAFDRPGKFKKPRINPNSRQGSRFLFNCNYTFNVLNMFQADGRKKWKQKQTAQTISACL